MSCLGRLAFVPKPVGYALSRWLMTGLVEILAALESQESRAVILYREAAIVCRAALFIITVASLRMLLRKGCNKSGVPTIEEPHCLQ